MLSIVEKYAIRCAKGNNGGEWATHYTEEQKDIWRKFIHDLIDDMRRERDDLLHS